MSYADAKLLTDYKIELSEEEAAMQDVYDQMDADAAERDKYSLYGSVIGGVIGFAFGGAPGAQIGYQVGKQAKYAAPQNFDTAYMDQAVYGGGKFAANEMMQFVNDVEYQDALEDLNEHIETAGDMYSIASNFSGKNAPSLDQMWKDSPIYKLFHKPEDLSEEIIDMSITDDIPGNNNNIFSGIV